MKINSKIIITVIIIFTLMTVVSTCFIVYSIKLSAENEIIKLKENEIAKYKQNLKNYVDLAYANIETNYKNALDKDYLKERYGLRLRSIIDVAETILAEKAKLAKEGKLTLEEAQNQAKETINNLRYDDGVGYIWVTDNTLPYPKMITHPIIPALNDTVLENKKYNCALGTNKNLFSAFVEVCMNDDDGYVDYIWPKPAKSGDMIDAPKLAYVRIFKEWGWVYGTGIYIDDAIKDCIEKTKSDIETMRYANGTGYFWINDMGAPIPKMVMHPIFPNLNDTLLNNPKYDCALGTNKNLFAAFVETCKLKGDGFVDYLWDKPTQNGIVSNVPKLSYVKEFKPLSWVVGTGVYIDDIDKNIKEKETKLQARNKKIILNTILFAVGSAFCLIIVLLFILKKINKDNVSTEKHKEEGDNSDESQDKTTNEKSDINLNEKCLSVNETKELLKVFFDEFHKRQQNKN